MPTVFLSDVLGVFKPATTGGITTQLQGYLDKVGAAIKPKEVKWTVVWSNTLPSLKPEDVLIHYCPVEYSVVSRMPGATKFDPQAHSHWGFTNISASTNSTGAEVYAKSLDVDSMTKLAFHEMMHNKLQEGNDMHKRGGLAAATVDQNSVLTPQNIADMAKVMMKSIAQWPDAYKFLIGVKPLRDADAPLWYL